MEKSKNTNAPNLFADLGFSQDEALKILQGQKEKDRESQSKKRLD